jgi:D-methionine transport system ATP-binding protein
MNEAVRLEGVSKIFRTAAGEVAALRATDLVVREGEILGLLGFSGAGKSTLLRVVNRLEEPSTGRVIVGGQDITALSGAALRRARSHIGMIFQSFNLLAQRNALENVGFALDIAGVTGAERRRRAEEALATVGLAEKARAYPAQLSGGQRQRVAIARALVNEPRLLLSDEATSALDPHSSLSILRFLKRLCRERGMTIILVTHDINVATYMCDRALVMERGAVVEEMDLREPKPVSALGKFFMETHRGWTDATVVPGEEAA